MNAFPKYELIIDDKTYFLTLGQAGGAYDNGWVSVSFGTKVLNENGSTREMTKEDQAAISEAADRHSEDK